MSSKATHKLVKKPSVNARYLSDYMVASERVKRTIVRNCKYPKIARIIQHDRAKLFISKFLRSGDLDASKLSTEAARLHSMMSDSDFERETLDVNGDFLDAYAKVFSMGTFPKAEVVENPKGFKMNLNGVNVNPDIRVAVQRVTRTNRIRTGLVTIRYAKGKPLNEEVGLYQSSALFGAQKMLDKMADAETEAEEKLCLTLDAVSGTFIGAPTNATSRFQNMEAACATIAERWDSIEPPDNAIFK